MILLFIIFALSGLLVFGWFKRVALRQAVKDLKAEIIDLRGRLSTSEKNYNTMARIAENALEVAKEKHFPVIKDLIVRDVDRETEETAMRFYKEHGLSQSTYKPPQVANCPKCAVSVRSDVWPISCPACSTPIDIEEWPDTIG
jgi:hypothetical protein